MFLQHFCSVKSVHCVDFRDFAKFGSLERSDDEIYKMLNVTGVRLAIPLSASPFAIQRISPNYVLIDFVCRHRIAL